MYYLIEFGFALEPDSYATFWLLWDDVEELNCRDGVYIYTDCVTSVSSIYLNVFDTMFELESSKSDDINLLKEGKQEDIKKTELEISSKLIEILDQLLGVTDWESSLFLRALKKKVCGVKNDADKLLQSILEEEEKKVGGPGGSAYIKDGYVRFFLLLYQMEWNKLSNWETAIRSLVNSAVINRPVYRTEDEVQRLIRSKKDVRLYGYAVIDVEAGKVYDDDNLPKDQFNQEMVMLKEEAVFRENIVKFIHANKTCYKYVEDRLIFDSEI